MNPDVPVQADSQLPFRLSNLLARLNGTIAVSEAMLASGRRIDLHGFESEAGMLCAACLDLAPEAGRAARFHLWALRERVERLLAAGSAR